MTDKSPLMTVSEVSKFTTYSRTQLFKLRSEGSFPKPVTLGVKRIAFVREEVEQWYHDRLAERAAVMKESARC